MLELDSGLNDSQAPNSVGSGGRKKPDERLFRLADIITREYLKINQTTPFIEQQGEVVLNQLQQFYQKEGCCMDNDDRAERSFLYRSLPLISGVIQLSSTVQNFNDAMQQIEKLYDLEDKTFDQATKLSYLVFIYAINQGRIRFSQDNTDASYTAFCVTTNVFDKENRETVERERFEKKIKRNDLWLEMRDQMGVLLDNDLQPAAKPPVGWHWYQRSIYYMGKVAKKQEELSQISDKTILQSKQKEIEIATNKAVKKLRQAIDINSDYQVTANDNSSFDSFWYPLAQDYAQQLKFKLEYAQQLKSKLGVEITPDIKDELTGVVHCLKVTLDKAKTEEETNEIKSNVNKDMVFKPRPIQDNEDFKRLFGQ